jgi:hypothetical protein
MLIWHSFISSPPLPLTYYLMQAQISHSHFSGLFLSSSVLTSNLAGHMYLDKLQALIWLSFSPVNHTSQAQTGIKCSSGSPLPPSPLAYCLTQAQMSHSCSSGLFLSSSILHSHIAGHMYPDELQVCVWFFFSLPTTHHKPRQAMNARLGLYFTLSPLHHPCCLLTTSCKPRQAIIACWPHPQLLRPPFTCHKSHILRQAIYFTLFFP